MYGADDDTVDFKALSDAAYLQQAAAALRSEGFRIVKLEASGWRTHDNNPMWVITEEL